MQSWHQFPFIRILIPFLAGILAAMFLQAILAYLLLILTLVFLLFGIMVLIFSGKLPYRFRWVYGVIINLFLFLAGYQITLIKTPFLDSQNIVHHIPTDPILIKITEPVLEKENSFKVIAECEPGYESDGMASKLNGKLLLYVEKSDSASKLQYGDRILISAQIKPINPPNNPGEFNYKQYLSNLGIYVQAYLKTNSWHFYDRNHGNKLKAIGIKLRHRFLEILRENNLYGKEYAVASAILLGYDENLDPEQKRQFAGAGAMHILCVSGLHVGIIYIILNSLLAFMNRKKAGRILKVFILLLLIWFYALITGFSPSVMRASTMFSFIIIGSSMRRKSHIYNSLAASAFLLMVIDPYIITAVGFQLSYLAVFGIVTLYKPIYNLFIPGNWLLDQIWSITVVSVSATIATFPLSIYYFHQFPNMFWLTNLIAIPASMLILYTGILVIITSPVAFISNLLAQLLIWVIRILNYTVSLIESFDIAVAGNLYITRFELFILLGIIFSISILLIDKRKVFAFIGLSLFIVMFLSISVRKIDQSIQANIVVFNVRNHSAIAIIKGREEVLIADSAFYADDKKMDYHVRNHLSMMGIREMNKIEKDQDIRRGWLQKKSGFIKMKNLDILILDGHSTIYPVKTKPKVDVIIFTENTRLGIVDVLQAIEFNEIIFDASNASWNVNRWIRECKQNGIAYHDVSNEGAWMADP